MNKLHSNLPMIDHTDLDYARDQAVETHGRSGAARLVLGSVADKIVWGAGVPVLLHRPQATVTRG